MKRELQRRNEVNKKEGNQKTAMPRLDPRHKKWRWVLAAHHEVYACRLFGNEAIVCFNSVSELHPRVYEKEGIQTEPTDQN